MMSASSTPGQTTRLPYTGGRVRPGQPRAVGQMVWRRGGRHRRQRSAGTSRCDTVAEETPPADLVSSSDALPSWLLRVSSHESQLGETPCLRTGHKRDGRAARPCAFLACALAEGKASQSPGFRAMRLSGARKEGHLMKTRDQLAVFPQRQKAR